VSRRIRRAWIVVGLLGLVLGHIAWWYWPRERAAAPDPASAAVRQLVAGDYDVCAWVPYPHQNLGELARVTGDFPQVLAAATRLAGSSAPEEMRSFGPFLVPPARELVACADFAGGRLLVAARVYPGLALIARLAGRLADNAWLAGGEVGRLRVEWRDGLWTVSAEGRRVTGGGERGHGDAREPGPAGGGGEGMGHGVARGPGLAGGGGGEGRVDGGSGSGSNDPPVSSPRELPAGLTLVRLARVVHDLPAGTYVLRRTGADLDVELAQPGVPAAISDLGPDPRPALLVASRPVGASRAPDSVGRTADPGASGDRGNGAGSGDAGGASPPAALALFAGSGVRWGGGASRDLRADLPGIALFHRAGAPARWGMPGGALGRLLNGALPRQEAAGWSILALDEETLRQAVAVAPRLAALLPPAPLPPRSGSPGALTFGLWIEPRAALDVVSRVRRFLDRFPFGPRQQVRHWHDWETVLQPLAACRHGAAVASALSPPFFHLRLESCAAR
jgi:hypothetical protein